MGDVTTNSNWLIDEFERMHVRREQVPWLDEPSPTYKCCHHCDFDCIGKYHPHTTPCKASSGGNKCLAGSRRC